MLIVLIFLDLISLMFSCLLSSLFISVVII